MIPSVVLFDHITPLPWRNGGGVTRELLAWPTADDWVVRLSVADIERDGPFSAFPGIDRWFAVLSGNGVLLGAPAMRVTRKDGCHAFDGALVPACHLISGPTRDLNLMIRRDVAQGALTRHQPATEVKITAPLAAPQRGLRGVFVVRESVLSFGGTELRLNAYSLAWSESDFTEWIVSSAAAVWSFQCQLRA